MSTELPEAYKKLIDGAKVVSFDVFDTLIHRFVFRPVDVFYLVAAQLKHHDFSLFNPGVAENFAQRRIQAEAQAREHLIAESGSPEVDLKAIYRVLSQRSGIADADVEFLCSLEVALEERLCHANPVMREAFLYARGVGKKIVLCSDMYLPSTLIERLLSHCGFDKPYELLVSGEHLKSKHEGNLWDEVFQRFSVRPEDIVHFGDNAQADVHMASAVGLQAKHFDYMRSEVETRLRLGTEQPKEDRHIWSLIQGTIRERLMIKERDFWEDIGLQVFGPLFLGNFLWFAESAKRDGIERFLFFARDAYLPYQLFLRYGPTMGLKADAKYVYFSRAALLLPSFVDMPLERIFHLFGGRSERTLAQHLQRIGIDPLDHLETISRAGFRTENDFVPNGDPRMIHLLGMLWSEILLESKRRRVLPLRYVEQLAGKAKRIGIVDIGWSGNMQGGFTRLLQLLRADYKVNGYYYGTFGRGHNHLPRNTFHGYLVNESEPTNWFESLTNGGVELLEFALMAPHGTTLGYREEQGEISPIFEDNAADKGAQLLAERVQKGAMEFIDALLPLIIEIGPQCFISQEWSRPFFRLVEDPSLEEAEILGELTHSDSATDTSIRLPLAEKLPKKAVKKNQEEFLAARKRAYWRRAFDVRNRAG